MGGARNLVASTVQDVCRADVWPGSGGTRDKVAPVGVVEDILEGRGDIGLHC